MQTHYHTEHGAKQSETAGKSRISMAAAIDFNEAKHNNRDRISLRLVSLPRLT
jgi:hypothetical protein